MTVRRIAMRALGLTVVVSLAGMLAITVVNWSYVLAQLAAAPPRLIYGLHAMLQVIAYAVALPALPIEGWIEHNTVDQSGMNVVWIGSLLWGAAFAAAWSGIDWLRRRRSRTEPGPTA